MASLKEVKGRIASVNSTRKITSAMKMVASAKLHKAQAAIESMLPYERRLHHILTDFMSNCTEVTSPFIVKREVKKVADVVFASNTSLCGGFNDNVSRHMADKPSYQEAADLAADLMKRFLHGDVDKVELLYNHFKSTASQILTRETYLPIDLNNEKKEEERTIDYILEPSAEELMQEMLPKVLRMKMFTVLLDSNAAEHAARTMAMQIATDNANELLQELTVMYNKSRQQSITNELLDIVGGSMA